MPVRADIQAMNTKSALLVEDDATCAKIYQSLLERHGYAVTTVADGSDAFMEAHHRVYDLILLDLMLPSMDGMAMLRRFRAQKRFSHTPIFLYTSSELSHVEPLALEAGVTRVFSKSLPAKELVQAMIDAVAGLRAARDPLAVETVEPDPRHQPDFRVPGKSATQPLTLRMADATKEPPPKVKPLTPRERAKNQQPPEPEPRKRGLFSRLFQSKREDS
jgi:two-component system, chemotaxis family, chemotaxis protein CheY